MIKQAKYLPIERDTIENILLSLFPSTGYFVEAGAHDGIGDSLTYHLELRGWNGICIEPSSAFTGLKGSRKCSVDNRCLYAYDDHDISFREISGNQIELSGIPTYFKDHWDRSVYESKDSFKKTVKLTTLLDQYKAPSVIEFLCLDTEGSEYDILYAHYFAKYLFKTMLVEYNNVRARRSTLNNLLGMYGYREEYFNETDLFFFHSSIKSIESNSS